MPSLPPTDPEGAALPLGPQTSQTGKASKTESTAIAKGDTSSLPEPAARRGVTDAEWRTLCNSLYPGANPNSVLMVLDYCKARKLDPMKKPCHIVPMEVTVKTSAGERREWRDVILPGIYELRTTAQRTGEYRGHSTPTLGPMKKQHGVEAPEWVSLTVYRGPRAGLDKDPFPVVTYFREVVALKGGGIANARWARAPIQMLTKCAEAAALREAFPDELGGQMTEEEMAGQRHPDVEQTTSDPGIPKPDGFDTWAEKLAARAREGAAEFGKAWQAASPELRAYLTRSDPEYYEQLKNTADDVDLERAEAKGDKGGA